MKSLENDIKKPESELRFGNGKQFKYGHVLRFTASSHIMQREVHAIAPKHGNKLHGRDPYKMLNKR